MTGSRGTKAISSKQLTIKSATDAVIAAGEAIDRGDPLAALLRLCVNYKPRDGRSNSFEAGVITGVQGQFVMVRYWGERSTKATTPECLTWAYPAER